MAGVIALERGFARAFWIGLIAELLATPLLVVLVAALAITVIGILLIPFAIVSYFVAARCAGVLRARREQHAPHAATKAWAAEEE